MSELLRGKIRSDRINIDPSTHRLYEKLKEENMPFSTMKDIFLAAAYFGIKLNKMRPLTSKQQIFQKGTFKDDELVDILALAIAVEKNTDVFQDGNALEVIEQYANGGIEELHDTLIDMDDPFEEIIQHLIIHCDNVI